MTSQESDIVASLVKAAWSRNSVLVSILLLRLLDLKKKESS